MQRSRDNREMVTLNKQTIEKPHRNLRIHK
jgi:hypothetical protein